MELVYVLLFSLLILGFIFLLARLFVHNDKYVKFLKWYLVILFSLYMLALVIDLSLDFGIIVFVVSLGVLLIAVTLFFLLRFLAKKCPMRSIKFYQLISLIFFGIIIYYFKLKGLIFMLGIVLLIHHERIFKLKIDYTKKYDVLGRYYTVKTIDDDIGSNLYQIEIYNIFGKQLNSTILNVQEYEMFKARSNYIITGSVIKFVHLLLFMLVTLCFVYLLVII